MRCDMSMARMRRTAQSATLVVVLLQGGAADAGEFASDGSFVFSEGAQIAFDFESVELPPLADSEAPMPMRVASDTALSGTHVIAVAPFTEAAFVAALPMPSSRFRASLWIRGGEAAGFVGVTFDGGDKLDEVAALYPTGRVTSDGWLELANDGIRIDGLRSKIAVGVFAPSGCELDAIEIHSEGPSDVPIGASCNGTADASACNVGQVCYWSRCRNVNAWVPPIPPNREHVTAYLESRLRFLFGPYLSRTLDLPNALIAIEQMRHAKDPFGYWNGFLLAVRRLNDGHTGTSGLADYAIPNPSPLDVCFIGGVADASASTAPLAPSLGDVLVSHVGSTRNLGLRPGDRLVRIDGVHPVVWARAQRDHYFAQPSAANHTTSAELLASLRSLVSRFADELEIVRCDAATNTCGPLEKLSITELAPMIPGEPFDGVECDHRPLRHLANSPKDHGGESEVFAGPVLEAASSERIYGVEWDSLYTTTGQDGIGANLNKAIKLLETDDATAVIFDHRRGTGGTIVGPQIIWKFARELTPLTLFHTRQRAGDEQPSLAQGMALFQAGLTTGDVDYAGGAIPAPIPVALLVTQDVSASDWLALGLKGAPGVRLFGPHMTSGSFSTLLHFGYWLGMSYTVATGDTFIADGSSLNGYGVLPDELVQPLESDLMLGRDTVFEAALAWVRSEKAKEVGP
ncbi:MAG: hypothetical protein EXR75_14365 [Myxococcales bacterium]|nr:hypothetical protein [Myxococcales bacterium]